MKRLKGWPAVTLVAVVIALLAAWTVFHHAPAQTASPTPTALVSVSPVTAGPVSRLVEAYGVVAGSASGTRTVSAPRDIIIERLLVVPGQPLVAGAPLLIVGDTPASALAYRQAANALTAAKQDLARIQRLYAQQMAANDQLTLARKAVADAKAAMAAQSAAGGGRSHQIIASPITGVVGQVSVAVGQQLTAGSPLLTVVARGSFVARLGVQPNAAAQLAAGQPVRIIAALDPANATQSKLSVVGQAVDPTTHLIAVTAPIKDAGLPLGAAVRGEITVAQSQGLTVPSAAVVYDEKGSHLFVIRAGKAHSVAVTTGPEQNDRIAVSGAVQAGDQVAVAGAYQLQDGMAVRMAAE